MFVFKQSKRKSLPKGFLTMKGLPTQNSLISYFIYLTNSPKDWDHLKGLHKPSIELVRQYFGVDYGFDVMMEWGIQYGRSKSKTSSERHFAMSKGYHDAKGLIGKGYVLHLDKID